MQSGARFIARERGTFEAPRESEPERETKAFCGTFYDAIRIHMDGDEFARFCAWLGGLTK